MADLTYTDEPLAGLRRPFEERHISKLPKPTKAQTDAVRSDFKKGVRCKECGAWHHPDVVHLDYVGHAALTDRLLDTDLGWSWEPVTFRDGLPAFDHNGGLWIRLTVCGVTRLGYGSADGKTGGDAIKEIIGDALRNAAMRFGAALDLWHKGDLHAEEETEKPKLDPIVGEPRKGRSAPLKGPIKTKAEIRGAIGELVRELHGCSDNDQLTIVLKDNRALIAQVEDEIEYWWNGDGADFIGLRGEIEQACIACAPGAGDRVVDYVTAG